MGINLAFTADDWARVEKAWVDFWNGDLERPIVSADYAKPAPELDGKLQGYLTNYPLAMPAEEVVDLHRRHLERTEWFGDMGPKWWVNFGPGIMAGFLGAKVVPQPGTVWFEPARECEVGEMQLAFDPENLWWQRVREITRVAVEAFGGQAVVGHTDLGGNLDILASLRTSEKLLMDLYDCPDGVARVCGEITRLWLRYYDELYAIIRRGGRGTAPWAAIWSPGRGYMLQSDFAYMISPEMFERFVVPDLTACCAHLDHGFYHLDGKGQIPHLDLLLGIERLRGIQWIPGDGQPPAENWLPLLKRIRAGGKRCQLFVSTEGARTIVKNLGGKGFIFHLTDGTIKSHGQFDAFMEQLRQDEPR
ncbi:MAG: hypothetical protein WC789_09115 [Lentisphaeria bacterium]|jgi:5-methyltetrahydrofolate--homocysteine methyltransferase